MNKKALASEKDLKISKTPSSTTRDACFMPGLSGCEMRRLTAFLKKTCQIISTGIRPTHFDLSPLVRMK